MSTGNGNQVTMTSPESDLAATYRKARSLPGGFYPSEVEISDRSGNWRITLETEKVRKNARLPDKIWMQD
jgi:outer membrane lipoprotein-sorting protein